MASLTADLTGSEPEEDTLFPEEAPAQRACISRRGMAMGVAGAVALALVAYVAFKPQPQEHEASAHTEDVMAAWEKPHAAEQLTNEAVKIKTANSAETDLSKLVCDALKTSDLDLTIKNIIDDVADITIVKKEPFCISDFKGLDCKDKTLVPLMTSVEVKNLQSAIVKKLTAMAVGPVQSLVDDFVMVAEVTAAEDTVAKEAYGQLESLINDKLKTLNGPIAKQLQDAVSVKISTWNELTSLISTPIADGFHTTIISPCLGEIELVHKTFVCDTLKENVDLIKKTMIDDVAGTIVGKETVCTSNFKGPDCKDKTLVPSMTSAEMKELQSAIMKKLYDKAAKKVEGLVTGDRIQPAVEELALKARDKLMSDTTVKTNLFDKLNGLIVDQMQVGVSGKFSTWDEVTSLINGVIDTGFQAALASTCT